MTRTACLLAFVFLSTTVVAACHGGGPPAHASATLSSGAPLSYADVVGTWQFVYTDARRAAVEAELTTKISDPIALAAAMRDAAYEADASEIELTQDARFLSRVEGKEILATPIISKATDVGGLELRSPTHEEMSVRVMLRDASTLVVTDPHKGELVFVRR